MSRRVVAAVAIAGLGGGAGCRSAESCLDLEPARDPAKTIALCSDDYTRTADPRAAVAVAVAHTARKDDAALVAWATRVGPRPGTALVWRRAAQAHGRQGQREAMLSAEHQALALWAQAGAPGEAAYEAHVLKEAYWQRSQLLPALEVARRERALALASDDREMQRGSFADLFGILDEIGDHAGAAALLQAAQQTHPADPLFQRKLRFCDGLVNFRDGRFELARLAYRDTLAIPGGANDAETTRGALYNLVEIEAGAGEVEAAARDLAAAQATLPAEPPVYQRAARAFFTAMVARARRDPTAAVAAARTALALGPPDDWAWQLDDELGRALEDQGQVDEAIAVYRDAIAVVERMRREVASDVLQLALRDRKRAPYEAVFALEAARGHHAAALEVAHLMWRRGFAESFAAEVDSGETADPAAERIRGITALVPQLPATARELAAPPPPPGGDDAVAADGAAVDVLAFVEARGALWRHQRRGGEARLDRLALPARDARRLVAALRAHPDDTALAAQLGAALVPERLVGAAARTPVLAIVADGALSGLPFAALRVAGRWLIEARAVVYWPDLVPIGAARSAATALPVVLAAPGGDPATRLAAVTGEAADVARMLGVTALTGARATIAGLRGGGGASVLHIAAHGGLAPGGAFVRLADGEVTATDIVTWRLAPRVVVLASCASGARPTGSMWGALGGAFLAAGSEAAVTTLWSVEDAATAALIHGFYTAGGARAPEAALAAAQRAAIAAGGSPRRWAAFAVLGYARARPAR